MTTTLIALVAGAVFVLGLIWWAMRLGRKRAEAKVVQARLDAKKAREEIENEVEGLPADAKRARNLKFVRNSR